MVSIHQQLANISICDSGETQRGGQVPACLWSSILAGLCQSSEADWRTAVQQVHHNISTFCEKARVPSLSRKRNQHGLFNHSDSFSGWALQSALVLAPTPHPPSLAVIFTPPFKKQPLYFFSSVQTWTDRPVELWETVETQSICASLQA